MMYRNTLDLRLGGDDESEDEDEKQKKSKVEKISDGKQQKAVSDASILLSKAFESLIPMPFSSCFNRFSSFLIIPNAGGER